MRRSLRGCDSRALVVNLWRHPGVKVSEFNAAVASVPPSAAVKLPGGREVPAVWVATKAQWSRLRSDAEAKLSEPTFTPAAVALLDDQISADALEWPVGRALTAMARVKAERPGFGTRTEKWNSCQTGNRAR